MDANKYGNIDSKNKMSSVALIYRTNAQSRALEEACVKYNLPYVIFGSATSFYKRREILDCLCFLRWIYNGRDRSAMLRAMKTPSRGIGDVAHEEFEQYCALVADNAYNGDAKPTPLDVLISLSDAQSGVANIIGVPPPTECISGRALKSLMLLSKQMRAIRDLAYQQPVEIVLAYIIDTLDLLSHFDKYSESKSEFEERKGNVQELQQASKRYTNQGPCLRLSDKIQSDVDMNVDSATSPLGTFLDDISLVTETADELQKDNDQRSVVVCLMTIHASKGMEFDQVFLVGNEDGIFPTSQAIMEGEGSVALEEEKRLCYVAMTRAKTELCLTWRREVPIFTKSIGRVTKRFDRSRFLDVLASKKKTTALAKNLISKSPGSPLSPPPVSSPKPSQRRDYTSSAWSSTSASDFQGTNSVYAINRPSAATSPSLPLQTKTYSPQQPWQKKGSSSAQNSPLSSSVRQQPSWRNNNNISKEPELPIATKNVGPQASSSPMNKKHKGGNSRSSTTASNTSPPPDSTWFFPVGSSVMHKQLGRGIVLQPPLSPPPTPDTSTATNNSRDDDNTNVDLLVRVKFPDSGGVERHFSARGSEITPILI
jgi:ATP-dependent exoDNAse (exonuclease V) beta subunit